MSRRLGRVAAAGVAVVVGASGSAWAGGTTERVSVATGGAKGNGDSASPAISLDGRFVAFESLATNLVPGDTNHTGDVFVRDRRTRTTERVSLGRNGAQGNGASFFPAISADGRFVAFTSDASNLVPGDTNGYADTFICDRRMGRTERVSVGTSGAQGNGASLLFPALSADGRFVAFVSFATNLVPGDTNDAWDVFVRDRRTGTTARASVGRNGAQGNDISYFPALSADGRFVAFTSEASNLVPGDTNGVDVGDVFVRDRRTRTTERVSLGRNGAQGNDGSYGTAISPDGRFVAFTSDASNLVPGDTNHDADDFVRDRRVGRTERVSVSTSGAQGNNDSHAAALSADGRFVAFTSDASNLVPRDTNGPDVADVFVHDRRTRTTERVSIGRTGAQGNDESRSTWQALSADGRFVAFTSDASNLVPGDTNRKADVFVRRRW
jgi:Tol biopolymer transport system component